MQDAIHEALGEITDIKRELERAEGELYKAMHSDNVDPSDVSNAISALKGAETGSWAAAAGLHEEAVEQFPPEPGDTFIAESTNLDGHIVTVERVGDKRIYFENGESISKTLLDNSKTIRFYRRGDE